MSLWDGNCPSCKDSGKTSTMKLNRNDFFECVECHLQLLVFRGVKATVLKFKGIGNYHSSETVGNTVDNGEVICLQNKSDWPFHSDEGGLPDHGSLQTFFNTIRTVEG